MRLAVVLFNLGGPDRPEAVRPFLFNLFNDPAIVSAPWPVRPLLARLISTTREKPAQANYALMGGRSPLLPETESQAVALKAALQARRLGDEIGVFVAMRYWSPLTQDTAHQVAAFRPDRVVLLPLYPQFSTTTTGSSRKAWIESYRGPGEVSEICCYPEAEGLVAAHAARILATWTKAGRPGNVRVLFSAHGLPERVVQGGDPYQDQVERTCRAVAQALRGDWAGPLDWQVCYQSRVGPLKWIGPSTPEALEGAARDGKGVLVTPIAFVSEHVETLVELDHEYAAMARDLGIAPFLRAPALGVEPAFIDGLTDAVQHAAARGGVGPLGRACDACFSQCPVRRAADQGKQAA